MLANTGLANTGLANTGRPPRLTTRPRTRPPARRRCQGHRSR
ncbi:MAG: hypothetical protein QOG28_2745, partial [Trebonia sp.]|nr:hypothetical protein [Trebonia sp.]